MRPPRLARLWLRLVAPAELRESLLDDLDEICTGPTSSLRAYGRYWRETLRGTPHLLRLRVAVWREGRPGTAALAAARPFLAIERLARDARHALRSLWREPTFALTATLTLALGIGATTAVFSVVDAELWKPLPFPRPHELMRVYARVGDRGQVALISGAELLDWRAGAPAFAHLAADGPVARQTLQLETAHSVLVSQVTANYFEVLTHPVVAGRTFTADDAREPGTAVLTDRVWRRLFGADPDPGAVGRRVTLDGRPVAIIGVVQANDSLGAGADVFVPLDERASSFLDRANPLFAGAVGRLAPGVDAVAAQARLDAINVRHAAERPDSPPERTIAAEDLSRSYRSPNWRPLYFLLGASVVVLLLSAVNVASLVLGRAFSRAREFALRGALGGGSLALARQLAAEGALLAVPAGALGLLLAQWTVGALAAELPDDVLLRGTNVSVDYRAAGVAFGVSALTTLLFALAPLAAARRIDLSSVLGAGSRTGRSRAEGRARAALLTSQLALTMVLVAGAAVFLKSFVALTQVPLGFDPEHLVALRTPLGGPRYGTEASVRAYADRVLEAVRATPGVQSVAAGSSSPLGSGPLVNFAFADRARPAAGSEPRAIIRAASPGYFHTLGIAMVRGREFTRADAAGAPRVAIVNQHLARQIAPDGNAIGHTIELLPGARAVWTRRPGTLMVVGVASNIKEVGLNEIEFADIYVPLGQMTPGQIEVIARTVLPPAAVAGAIRSAVAGVDPGVPASEASAFDQRVDRALRPNRFNLLLVSGFAALGVLLAGVGIYGTIAYGVATRTRELGVRLALGARPVRLMGSAVWDACRIGLAGGALGLLATLVLAGAIGDALYLVPGSHNGLLYGVRTTDPIVLAAAFAGINAVAVLAAVLPARRIARVDPVRALRRD